MCKFSSHNLWKTLVEKWKTQFFEKFVQSDEFYYYFFASYKPSSAAEALSDVSAKTPLR